MPDITDWRLVRQYDCKPALDNEARNANVKINSARVLSRVKEALVHDRTAVVVCYGPTLKRTWPQAAIDRTYPGRDIVTVSGAHKFLMERNVPPHIHIDCDPRPTGEHLGQPSVTIRYWLASCCNPAYVERLNGFDLSLWHLWNGDESASVWADDPAAEFMVFGGGNVGLRAIPLLYSCGYRKFAIHGMDSCFDDEGAQYAGAPVGKDHHRIMVTCNGKLFQTSATLVQYARQFADTARNLVPDAQFEIHGGGLLAEMQKDASAD